MRKIWMAALAALMVLGLAACGDPVKGQPCDHEGDVWAGHGRALSCVRTDNGLRWQ